MWTQIWYADDPSACGGLTHIQQWTCYFRGALVSVTILTLGRVHWLSTQHPGPLLSNCLVLWASRLFVITGFWGVSWQLCGYELLCLGQGSSVGLGHQELVTCGYIPASGCVFCTGEVTAARMNLSPSGCSGLLLAVYGTGGSSTIILSSSNVWL